MKFFKSLYSFIKDFILRVSEDRVSVYAAQASFFILISSIPFLMLLLGFAKYFIPFSKPQILNVMSHLLPKDIYYLGANIINELFSRTHVGLISATALTLMWSASRGVLSVIEGLNAVSRCPRYRFLQGRIIAFFYTFLFILTPVITLLVLLFGTAITEFIGFNIYIPLLLVLLVLIFATFYKFLPRCKSTFKSQLPGAFLSSISWVLFTWVYSLYIENFSNFSYIYGSLSAIILLMLWLYFCTTIFLYGAEFNQIIRDNEIFKKTR